MVKVSCIIPTFNRCQILMETLSALNAQSYLNQFEAIIVNDGSTDGTDNFINEYIRNYKGNKIVWQYIHQENKGPSVAKNNGVKNANGKYIIFLNDDTIPDKDFVNEHINLLRNKKDICSLGIVKWHHNAKNENLKVFEKVGIEINYTKIMNPEDCNFNYFCTANIGLSKELLLTEQFDENFPYPAMEDTELGYRFSRKGIKIILNQKAIVYHLHHYDEDALIKRQEKIGKSTKELVKKYPELKSLFIKPNPKVIFVLAVIFKNVLRVVNKNKRFLKDLYWLALATYSKYRYCI